MRRPDFILYRYPSWIKWCGFISRTIIFFLIFNGALSGFTTAHWFAFALGVSELLFLNHCRKQFREAAMTDARKKNVHPEKVRFL